MKKPPPTQSQPTPAEAAELFPVCEYREVLAYWRDIARKIEGRSLHYWEWAIARHAYLRLVLLRPMILDLLHENLPPSPPSPIPLKIPEITPFQLAQIAVALAASYQTTDIPSCFPFAIEVLGQAAAYLEKGELLFSPGFSPHIHNMEKVSFKEIIASNDKNSKTLKLLPGITTEEGLKKFIRRYQEAHLFDRNLGGVITKKTDEWTEIAARMAEVCDKANARAAKAADEWIAEKAIPINRLLCMRFWKWQKKHYAAKSAQNH